jgi:hypothetical protein
MEQWTQGQAMGSWRIASPDEPIYFLATPLLHSVIWSHWWCDPGHGIRHFDTLPHSNIPPCRDQTAMNQIQNLGRNHEYMYQRIKTTTSYCGKVKIIPLSRWKSYEPDRVSQ